MKAVELAFGAFVLFCGIMGLFYCTKALEYYGSPMGQYLIAMSEAARNDYENAKFYFYVNGFGVLAGLVICAHAVTAGPKETRICTKCGRSLSSFSKEIKLCPYCGNQLQ